MGHTRPQPTMRETRVDFVAGIHLCRLADKDAVGYSRNNGKAARKRCERAHHVQGPLCKAKTMLRAYDPLLQRMAQAPSEKFVAGAQIAHEAVRRMTHETREDVTDTATRAVQFGSQCACEPQLKIIEPLLLLSKPHSRMCQRETLACGAKPAQCNAQLAPRGGAQA